MARYRTHVDDTLTTHRVLDSLWVQSRLQTLAAHDTEQDVVLADITNAGLNPDPPPDRRAWRLRRLD